MSELTHDELERRFVFALIVAGKNARFAENAVGRLFDREDLRDLGPFDQIIEWWHTDTIDENLKRARTGNYKKLIRAFDFIARMSLDIDLENDSPDRLERVPGCGPKTSRFFILWTRPNAEYAALDVHILRWLRIQGHDAPSVTPTAGKKYNEWEAVFLDEARKRNMKPAALDAQIWESMSQYGEQGNWYRERKART